jgi:hypothetical protein
MTPRLPHHPEPSADHPPFTRRITPSVASVLLLFLADLEREWYATEMAHRMTCPASTATRILHDLRWAGWAVDREEPARQRQPARFYHRLTETGVVEAKRALLHRYPTGSGLALLAHDIGLSIDTIDLDVPGGET